MGGGSVPKYLNFVTFSNNLLPVFVLRFFPAFPFAGRQYMSVVPAFTAGPASLLAANEDSAFFVCLRSRCRSPRDGRQTQRNSLVHICGFLMSDAFFFRSGPFYGSAGDAD